MRKWLVTVGLIVGVLLTIWALPVGAPAVAVVSSPAEIAATAPPAPRNTAVPTPSPWRFHESTTIAGVDVQGLTREEAEQRVAQTLAGLFEPLVLMHQGRTLALKPETIGVQLSVSDLVQRAYKETEGKTTDGPLSIPLELALDQQALRGFVEALSSQIDQQSSLRFDAASKTFEVTPGATLDVDASLERIVTGLHSPDERYVTLVTREDPALPLPKRAQILEALEPQLERLDSVAGIYVANMDGEELFSYNPNTVFSGASTMKIAIMIQTFISVAKPSKQVDTWLWEMVTVSDNDASNNLLATVGKVERGSFDSLQGLQVMNRTLRELGLEYTGQTAPYEASQLVLKKGIKLAILTGKGEAPYTDADPYLHATPAEMGRLLLLIGQCAQGRGELLELYDTLSPARCKEMIELMQHNEDHDRLAAGLPKGVPLAHKSGWIADMRADVGLVGSGEDALVFSIWLWVEGVKDYEELPDEIANPIIANLTRTLYSAFNPNIIRNVGSGRSLRSQ